MVLNIFQAGKGINATKINDNFSEVQNQSNTNESDINYIYNNALFSDGTNLSQSIINEFHKQTPIVLENQSGTISLLDNSVYFLSLSSNTTIQLPVISTDVYSHTIIVYVQGHSGKTLTLGTTNHFYNDVDINLSNPYSVMYVYNKIDGKWYYSITQ